MRTSLTALHQPNFQVQLVDSGHALLANSTGLAEDDDRAPGLAPGVIESISRWVGLRAPAR